MEKENIENIKYSIKEFCEFISLKREIEINSDDLNKLGLENEFIVKEVSTLNNPIFLINGKTFLKLFSSMNENLILYMDKLKKKGLVSDSLKILKLYF